MKQRLVAIVGPTASGKTGLAVNLALACNGEVISADSRQVYKELDIGTEKVTRKEMRGVPHHCIDIASPRRAFTVEQWHSRAEKAVCDIASRGSVPIVAGGTGFYVDTLVYGRTYPKVKPNTALRKELERKDVDELFKELTQLDPERAATIEKENPRRLIRAIEIARQLGAVPPLSERHERYDTLWIGINPPFSILEERIAARLKATLRRGLVAETRYVREMLGLSWKRINELGLEYRIVGEHLRGELTKDELYEKLYRDVRRYAKRQLRWLKRNKTIHWYPDAKTAFQETQATL